jgi:hypothetical protein
MDAPFGVDQSIGAVTMPQSTSGLVRRGSQSAVDGTALAVLTVLMAAADPAATAATAAATMAARTPARMTASSGGSTT